MIKYKQNQEGVAIHPLVRPKVNKANDSGKKGGIRVVMFH